MVLHLKKVEIDHHTIKLIIGVIALSLATLTNLLTAVSLESISASYHEDGAARNVFVGFLYAIAAFLLAYNGRSVFEMVMSKVASVAAIGVAMFPCACDGKPEIIPYVHAISAAVMFVILAIFCYLFYGRAKVKEHPQAKVRAGIYVLSGLTIVASILIIAIDGMFGGFIKAEIPRLTFYGEAAGLIAFGVAWLTASRSLPLITHKEERYSLSPFTKD